MEVSEMIISEIMYLIVFNILPHFYLILLFFSCFFLYSYNQFPWIIIFLQSMTLFWKLTLLTLFSLFSLNLKIKHQSILKIPLHSFHKPLIKNNAPSSEQHLSYAKHTTSPANLNKKVSTNFTTVKSNQSEPSQISSIMDISSLS